MRWQRDRLSSANRADLARPDMAQAPGAKAHQADLMAFCHVFAYHLGEGADDLARLFEGKASLGSDLVDQFVLANRDRLGAVSSRLCLRCWHDFLLAR